MFIARTIYYNDITLVTINNNIFKLFHILKCIYYITQMILIFQF